MSRAAATSTDKLTRTDHIFATTVTDRDKKQSQIISSQSLADSSVRVNRAWDDERWERKGYVKTKCTNAGALRLLLLQCLRDGIQCKNKVGELRFNQWQRILQFLFGSSFIHIGQYTAAVSAPSFFPRISEIYQGPWLIVDATMRGQEDVVMNILRVDSSYLLKTAKVENSVGVEYEVTALQAAIMAWDVQMVERMQEHFARLTTDSFDATVEMHRQIKEIYKLSLQEYRKLQKIKIAALEASQEYGLLQDQVIGHLIGREQHRYNLYQEALRSDDIDKIFKTHNSAQENNAFDFRPYIDAILDAPEAQLADVMAIFDVDKEVEKLVFSEFDDDTIKELQNATEKMPNNTDLERALVTKIKSMRQKLTEFSINEMRYLIQFADTSNLKKLSKKLTAQIKIKTDALIAQTGVSPKQTDGCQGLSFERLTLVQKLNRFRERFVEHMQEEIIFNPHHILAGLESNLAVWNTLSPAQDQHYHKRSVIFSQLCGWAQRNAAEPVKQDIRQGIGYLVEENEPRSRQSRFNDWNDSGVVRNSLVDSSLIDLSGFGGLGYKFLGWWCGGWSRAPDGRFSKLMSNKNSELSELITPRVQSTHCVIQ